MQADSPSHEHNRVGRQLTSCSVVLQTLAYLLPVMTAAIARAEAETKAAAAASGKRQQQQWGTLQAVIVVPSRELAMQIVRVAQGLLPPGARGAVQQCIGGANPHRQVQCLPVRTSWIIWFQEGHRYRALMRSRTAIRKVCVAYRGSQGFRPATCIIQRTGASSVRAGLAQAQAIKENRPVLAVGTPGRLAELSREGVLQTHRTPALVLDEVDQLLAPNFREDLSRILEHTGEVPVQTLTCTASGCFCSSCASSSIAGQANVLCSQGTGGVVMLCTRPCIGLVRQFIAVVSNMLTSRPGACRRREAV